MGARGEGWVIGQFLIGAAILVSPFFGRAELPLFVRAVGIVLLLVGALLGGLGVLHLGKNLSPFPRPKENEHTLVRSGVYALVRHPIYAGFTFAALGWTLWWGTLLGFALTVILFVWFDLKSRREERWLAERYPDYQLYQHRVRKLIPFVY
jgi:protein-S-isoprenylcysteine O-methyltransferase Ste14